MKASAVTGIAFAIIAVTVAVGAVALNGVSMGAANARPLTLDVLGLGWLFLLWGGLVTLSVFLIAWVAEGMAADEGSW